MPLVLPDPDSFARSTRAPGTQIIAPANVLRREDFSGQSAVGNAISQLGEDIKQIAVERQTRTDDLEYTRAETAFKVSNMQAVQAFGDDNEYKTYDERYSDGISKARDKLAETITNPRLRERFNQSTTLGVAGGRAKLIQKARVKEIDYNRAALEDSSELTVEAFVGAELDSDREELSARHFDELSKMVNNGYITEQERENLEDKFRHDTAQGRLGSMTAREQLAVIKENPSWLKGLSIRERQSLQNAAKKVTAIEDLDSAVFQATYKILASGGTYEQQIKKANSIKNADVRDDVQKAINNQYQQQSKIRAERERGAQDDGFEVFEKGGSYQDIPATTRFEMGSAKSNQLKQMFEDRGKAPPEDQDSYYAELTVDGEKNPAIYGELSLADIERNVPKSRQEEVKKMRVEAIEGRPVPPAKDGVLQLLAKRRVPDLLGYAKKPKSTTDIARVGAYHREFDKRIDQFKADNGKLPTREQAQDIIDDMLIEIKYDGPSWFTDDVKKAFELEKEDFLKIKSIGGFNVKDIPDDFVEDAFQAFHRMYPNRPIPDELIPTAYLRKMQADNNL